MNSPTNQNGIPLVLTHSHRCFTEAQILGLPCMASPKSIKQHSPKAQKDHQSAPQRLWLNTEQFWVLRGFESIHKMERPTFFEPPTKETKPENKETEKKQKKNDNPRKPCSTSTGLMPGSSGGAAPRPEPGAEDVAKAVDTWTEHHFSLSKLPLGTKRQG